MRLINTSTLELTQFIGNQIPEYAILSHTWLDSEITLKDVGKGGIKDISHATANYKRASLNKIHGTCKQAISDEYEWVWIDCCCIDKESSSELQEAINSMWSWYQNANICYVYLIDVPYGTSPIEVFRSSRWFSRGWTLQELIAPSTVEFFAQDWTSLGTKLERIEEISSVTRIHKSALQCGLSASWSNAAEKMSWAAHRQVTRAEDMAYCLLGLFDVNMPMLYGEGGSKAFIRLQEEIFKRNPDHSLFLFTYCIDPGSAPLLADSPARFCQIPDCWKCPRDVTVCFERDITYRSLRIYDPSTQLGVFESHTSQDELLLTKNGIRTCLWILNPRKAVQQNVIYPPKFPRTGSQITAIALLNVAIMDTPNEPRYLGLCLFKAIVEAESFIRYSTVPAIFNPPCFHLANRMTLFISQVSAKAIPQNNVIFEMKSNIYSIYDWQIEDYKLNTEAGI